MSVPKVAIAVPYYRTVEGPTALCLLCMGLHSGRFIEAMPIDSTGCYVEDNRNGYVQYFKDTGIEFDFLFSVDADMIFPADALMRSIAHNKDIVGANYRTRKPPHDHAAHYVDASGDNLLVGGLHEMTHIPTGLMLARWEIFQKMEYPWFKPGLRGEERDDVYFCKRARALGYKVWCDHDLSFEVRHRDVYDIPWFTPDQLVKVEEGVELSYQRAAAEAKMRATLSRQQHDAVVSRTPPSAGASTGRNGVDDAGLGV